MVSKYSSVKIAMYIGALPLLGYKKTTLHREKSYEVLEKYSSVKVAMDIGALALIFIKKRRYTEEKICDVLKKVQFFWL